MSLLFCEKCQMHYKTGEDCFLCEVSVSTLSVFSRPASTLLLGLSLVGCGDDNTMQPAYGVPMQDADGDGFFLDDDDCNDEDPDINPDAEEIPGDGVDSNCDGEDDT